MKHDALRAKILVIEDEPDLRDAIVSYLTMESFSVIGTGDFASAERWMNSHAFDIVILDLGLPDGDGIEWLNSRRDLHDKGVIIITARGSPSERLLGARAGSDIYLVKPVQLEELILTTERLARRLKGTEQLWQLDPMSWTLVSPAGQSLKLTGSEAKLLGSLCASPGSVVTRSDIIAALGHDPDIYDPRRLEVLVRRLRQKSKEAFGADLPVESVYGQGFSFVAPIKVA